MTAIGARLSSPNVVRFAPADILPAFLLFATTLLGSSFWELRNCLEELIRLLRHSFRTSVLFAGQEVPARPLWPQRWRCELLPFPKCSYGIRVRPDPSLLLSFLALASVYALIRFLENRSVKWFAIIVLAVDASLYSHNMMFFYLLALNVTWLTYPSARDVTPPSRRNCFLPMFLRFSCICPWLPSLLAQVAAVHGERKGPGYSLRLRLPLIFSARWLSFSGLISNS